MRRIACALIAVWSCAGALYAADDAFEFVLNDGLTPQQTAHLRKALDDNYDRILSSLGLTSIPTVTVRIWRDEEAYQSTMEQSLGSRAPGSRGYAFGQRELRLLYHTRLSAQREAVHEFAHVASLNINPDLGNNPRWLWEAVAIYLAGEYVDPARSGFFDDGACPTLEQLNAPFDRGGTIYATGYLLVDFIEKRWGFAKVVDLIRSNGDLQETLGVSSAEFEQAWCESVQEALGR